MSEQKLIKLGETLLKLYCDQYGIENPLINVTKKDDRKED